ncbi:RNA-directed DNA polymerase, eukaryota, partial [Tanacetum coccineum]
MERNIFESFKIIVHGKIHWIQVKEVSGWVPDFMKEEESDIDSDEEIAEAVSELQNSDVDRFDKPEGDTDNEVVSEMIFEVEHVMSKHEDAKKGSVQSLHSEDPFNLYALLNKKKHGPNDVTKISDDTLKYPPGFTPVKDFEEKRSSKVRKSKSRASLKEEDNESACTCHFKRVQEPQIGGSILQLLEDIVKVGQTMGYRMDGHNSTVSDYFVAIQGEWIPNSKKCLIISVYAPQEVSEKKRLWDYFLHLFENWNGENFIMGDFNEVRSKDERYGSLFNVHSAAVFNSFISLGGLVEVPLGGCSYTWCHKSRQKMSKLDRFLILEGLMGSCPNIAAITLDRYLSDHMPILLREVWFDYGPVPFRLFHYWFKWEGFDKFVTETWSQM